LFFVFLKGHFEMDIEHLTPVTQLKGHRAPVITLRHAKKSFLGDKILASGSGNK
jgi:hypothetical protein